MTFLNGPGWLGSLSHPRYRAKIARQRVSEIARLGDVLQDAGIKIDSVASSIATKSGRAMIEALIDGSAAWTSPLKPDDSVTPPA